ncbi:MAG: hypothetical protein MI867_20930, partial [Pseudomonadales bacterium]|nr:hypothetical protein [Pseudomonadales bacterium]
MTAAQNLDKQAKNQKENGEDRSTLDSSAFAHNPTVRAWVEALFPAGEQLPAPDATGVASEVDQYFASIPGLQQAIKALLASLEMRFWLSNGKSFSSAPIKDRRAFIEKHR